MNTKMPLPNYVKAAISALERAGKEAYVVGGCVRDALREEEPHDYDLTTSATPSEMQTIFAAYRTIETGVQHGTLTVLVDGNPLEITTYRIDGTYADGRHPDAVQFTENLVADLARRDFTVNAMAYHPTKGLVDPFHGCEDLKNRIVRAVGEPQKRFGEDGLRILRALRFAATLSFSIEERTAQALHAGAPLLKKIAAERICVEFSKLLCGEMAGWYLCKYSDTVSVFLPQIAGYSAQNAAKLDASPKELPLRLALLFLQIGVGSEAKATMRALRYDNHTARVVQMLLETVHVKTEPNSISVKRSLAKIPPDMLPMQMQLRVALGMDTPEQAETVKEMLKVQLEAGVCYSIQGLAVGGKELAKLGVPPGREMGALLQAMLIEVIEERLPNTPEALLAFARKMKH